MNAITHVFARIVVVGLAALLGASAAGEVTESYYNGVAFWNFQRVGIPDLDQERQGLPEDGACYCVPTCTMNLLVYAANHGFPEINPGPGIGSHFQYTNEISLLGGFLYMDVCAGGGEAGNEGDCIVTDCDNNGDCAESCGSTSTEQSTEAVRDWLAVTGADEKFTFHYWRAGDPEDQDGGYHELRLKHLFQISFLEGAPLMRINYGRYAIVGYEDGFPIYKRGGGHAMSFAGCRSNGDDKELTTMDPGSSESPPVLDSQSPFTTSVYDNVSDMVLRVTEEDEAPFNPVLHTMTYLGTESDGDRQLLDRAMWIAPKKGYTWSSFWIQALPLGDTGFGTDLSGPGQVPISGGSVVDLVLDPMGIGCVALVLPEVGLPQVKYINRILGEVSLIAEVGGAVAVATGRQHDLYVLTDATGGTSTTRRFIPALLGELSDYEESSDTLTLPFPLHGAVFDDETDELVMVSSSASKIVRAPRNLGSEVDPVWAWDIPTTVPMSGEAHLAVEPGQGRTWVATSASHSLYGLSVDPSGLVQVETISRPDITNPASLAFDDGGRMYVRADAGAIVLRRDPTGLWHRDVDAEAPFGSVALGQEILVDRSRSNFDLTNADESQWKNIPPAELEFLGGLPCPWDCGDDDGVVGVVDFLALLAQWGGAGACDFDGGGVGVVDFLDLLANWGGCP